MKTLFFLAFLALAVTSAVARADTTCSQSYGGQSQQQQQQLLLINLGRAYLQQCTPRTVPFTYATGEQASSCQVMRQQFCQQLAQIPEQFRCQAINGVAQAIMQQQQQQQQQQSQGSYQPEEQAHFHIMMAALHTLPQMCAVYVPPYCIITTTSPCSIAKAATSAGGAYY